MTERKGPPAAVGALLRLADDFARKPVYRLSPASPFRTSGWALARDLMGRFALLSCVRSTSSDVEWPCLEARERPTFRRHLSLRGEWATLGPMGQLDGRKNSYACDPPAPRRRRMQRPVRLRQTGQSISGFWSRCDAHSLRKDGLGGTMVFHRSMSIPTPVPPGTRYTR